MRLIPDEVVSRASPTTAVPLLVMVKDLESGSLRGVWRCSTAAEISAAVVRCAAHVGILIEAFICGVDVVACVLDGEALPVIPGGRTARRSDESDHADAYSNLGVLPKDVRKDCDGAEHEFREVIRCDPPTHRVPSQSCVNPVSEITYKLTHGRLLDHIRSILQHPMDIFRGVHNLDLGVHTAPLLL